jgi:hypothetical protein
MKCELPIVKMKWDYAATRWLEWPIKGCDLQCDNTDIPHRNIPTFGHFLLTDMY